MDIIHANHELADVGFVQDIDQLDCEISQETNAELFHNSFALIVPDRSWEKSPIKIGDYIYVPGTEFGGKIEALSHSTEYQQVTVSGLNWRGLLARKVIEPPEGEAYNEVRGEANAAILGLVGSSLGDHITISTADSGVTVSRDFRYTNMLTGIHQMLAEQGAALKVEYDQAEKKVVLSAVKITDYSALIDLSQDYGVGMITTEGGYDRYNHVIALGAGELLDRDILHVYRNDNGTLTTTPPVWAGTEKDQVTTYDYTNPEDLDELQRGAEKRLVELLPLNQIEMDPRVEGLDLNLGDIVGARDRLTGMAGTATVVGKILTMNSSGIKLETRVK